MDNENNWSAQQSAGLKEISAWLNDKKGPQIFRLFGYAGTGKTTIAKEIAGLCSGIVLFAAFTGKASLVLRKKGCDASTIHSLIYRPSQDPDTGKVTFRLNPDSPVMTTELVIIDEVSMVDEALAHDLLSYGKRVLVLGDPAQLPPVKGTGYFINAAPDVMLTEIHRQAADNPIIRLSMDVREGRRLALGDYGSSRIISRAQLDQGDVLRADQVLVGMNKTRRAYNMRLRQLQGITSPLPVGGDRLVCLKNNREKGLLNGSLWQAETARHVGAAIQATVTSLDDIGSGVPVDISVPVEFFEGRENDLDWRARRKADEFDYGYALTVHKAQGSQFDNVMLFDESGSFRDSQRQWLYTGITRAADRVTIVQLG